MLHSVLGGEPETTYLGDSLKNGAPGSSSAVRVDHAGANISKVRRPSKIARQVPVMAPMASPILGSNPNSNVQDGFSYTPSRAMNSCTLIAPTVINSVVSGAGWPGTRRTGRWRQTHRRSSRRPNASSVPRPVSWPGSGRGAGPVARRTGAPRPAAGRVHHAANRFPRLTLPSAPHAPDSRAPRPRAGAAPSCWDRVVAAPTRLPPDGRVAGPDGGGQESGANRAVKWRRCRGWDTMRKPGRLAARLATRVRTSMT